MIPFCPVLFGVSVLKLSIRKKGALIIKGYSGIAWFALRSAPGVGIFIGTLGGVGGRV